MFRGADDDPLLFYFTPLPKISLSMLFIRAMNFFCGLRTFFTPGP